VAVVDDHSAGRAGTRRPSRRPTNGRTRRPVRPPLLGATNNSHESARGAGHGGAFFAPARAHRTATKPRLPPHTREPPGAANQGAVGDMG
jgi:hypothetical protein